MRFGLHLRGGGAKGAFQSACCARSGSGASIIRWYPNFHWGLSMAGYVLHNAYKELRSFYLGLADDYQGLTFSGLTVDNSRLIDRLRSIKELPSRDRCLYVNYVSARDGQLREFPPKISKWAASSNTPGIHPLEFLLPYNSSDHDRGYLQRACRCRRPWPAPEADPARYVYDGLNFDGGMVNNLLIRQVFNHPAERVIVIGYTGTRRNTLTR